jgi:UDP-N-acetylmuramoylalanine--D-glutamate ligase
MINFLKDICAGSNKIMILGFGREGRSSYKLLRKYMPDLHLSVADLDIKLGDDSGLKNDKYVSLLLGDNYQDSLANYDLIIKSPGVKIKNINEDIIKKITSQTDLFVKFFSKNIIGVTGTKGKSTTSSLIKHILDSCGFSSVLLGNIGIPAFDMISEINSDTIIVYELSAHQLEYISKPPHIGVLLNIYPEHLDYFDSLEDYINAKKNIYNYHASSDLLITNAVLAGSIGPDNHNVDCFDGDFGKLEFEFDSENLPLAGNHNMLNIRAALMALKAVGANMKIAERSIYSFKSLPHRLEFAGKYAGIRFINDSISTIPESTIAAINTHKDVDTLILGGYDRGLDYNSLADFLIASLVKRVIFLGDAGMRIHNLICERTDKELYVTDSIEDAFVIIRERCVKGGICLLSPAAASYDQFHNFEHRGDTFKLLASKM